MKRLFILLLGMGLLAQFGMAQQPLASPGHADASSRVMTKFHQVILLAQILPINFTKPEWNTVLDAVEKARDQVRKTMENEYNVLIGDEPDLDDMIDAALKKQQEPDLKKLAKVEADLKALGLTREIYAASNVEEVFKAVKQVADAGQLKDMQNTLDIKALDSSKDPKTMSDDDKLRFFIKYVILDPEAYGLMVKLSLVASPGKGK